MPDLREVFEMVTKQVEPDVDEWGKQERRQRRHTLVRKAGVFAMVASLIAVGLIVYTLARDPARTTVPGTDLGSTPPTGAERSKMTDVGVTLTDSGCTMRGPDEPISGGIISFGVSNETDGFAAFDIGRLADGHTVDELARDIENASPSEDVRDRRPSYFEGSLMGEVTGGIDFFHGGGPGPSLLQVQRYGQAGATWSGPIGEDRVRPATYAVICYAPENPSTHNRRPWMDRYALFEPVDVVGPVEVEG